MKKITYFICLIGLISLFACKTNNEQNVNGQRIYDEQGLLITLEWNTGSGSEQAKLDANLDMFIEFKGKEILWSEWVTSFESLNLFSFYQDENYYIKTFYANGVKTVNYTIYVRGISDTLANDVRRFYGTMQVNQVGNTQTGLTITKSGNQYTLR